MVRQISVEEDVRAQRVVNEIYEVLEKYDLNSIVVFDQDSKSLKEVYSLSINGTALQINSESWEEVDLNNEDIV